MLRSDEAKTWRYRGKNVNQLKSLTLKAFSRPVLYTRGIMDQLSNDLCQTDGRTTVLTRPSCQVWLSLVCCPTNGHDTQTEGRLTLEKYILSFVIVSLPIFTLKDQFNILADKVLYFFFNICNTSSRMYLYLYIHKYSTSAGCSFLWTLHPDWQKLCVWPSQHFSSVLYCTSALGPSVTCPS